MSDKYKAGDEVIVKNRHGVKRLSIDRVARKYFYVREGWAETAFEIATGGEKVQDRNHRGWYSARAFTPDEYEIHLRSVDLLRRWNEHGLTINARGPLHNKLSDDVREKILEILDAEVARIDSQVLLS